MKIISAIIALAFPASGAPLLDAILDSPPSIMASFGKPEGIAKDKSFGWWIVEGWHFTATISDKKISKFYLDKIPRNENSKNIATMAKKIGFTKARGWSHGQKGKKGIMKSLILTHLKKGIFMMTATPGDGGFSLINVKPL